MLGAGRPHSPWADLTGWEGAGRRLKYKGLSPGLVQKEAKDMGAWRGPSQATQEGLTIQNVPGHSPQLVGPNRKLEGSRLKIWKGVRPT